MTDNLEKQLQDWELCLTLFEKIIMKHGNVPDELYQEFYIVKHDYLITYKQRWNPSEKPK
jgi:hypothetical protein